MQISATEFKELNGILESYDFFGCGNWLVKLCFALVTGVLVEYRDALGMACIDFIRGDMIYPLAWHGDNVTECAFASKKRDGYYLQVHHKQGSGWQ